MKAAVATAYGGPDVVEIRDLPMPVPRSEEVLIRVVAATVTSADARVRAARFPSGFHLLARLFFGIRRPRRPILGSEAAGVVEAVGDGVTGFKTGDAVFVFNGAAMGCHAEFIAIPENGPLAKIPDGFSFDEAAAIGFGGTTALYFLRDVAKLQSGERVLINGASGAVGSAAVQLARHFGAHVMGVCSAANADFVRGLGADVVIDYEAEDFTQRDERWDVIVDTVGNAPFRRSRPVLNRNGRLLLVVAGLGDLLLAPLQGWMSGCRIHGGGAPDRAEDIVALQTLCASGAFRPAVSQRYSLAEIREAYAAVDTGRKVGNIVLSFDAAEA